MAKTIKNTTTLTLLDRVVLPSILKKEADYKTLKGGGGTLHAVIFGAKGANGNTLTIYDNTAGSGSIIIAVDLANVTVGSAMQFNGEGLNFYNGLTYVSTGTTASFTFLWD